MWPFKKPKPKQYNMNVPKTFNDWTPEQINMVSSAMRRHGQEDSADWRQFAVLTLDTLRGPGAVELVARAMDMSANPGRNPEDPISYRTGHYLAGYPGWSAYVEYAKPVVELIGSFKIKEP